MKGKLVNTYERSQDTAWLRVRSVDYSTPEQIQRKSHSQLLAFLNGKLLEVARVCELLLPEKSRRQFVVRASSDRLDNEAIVPVCHQEFRAFINRQRALLHLRDEAVGGSTPLIYWLNRPTTIPFRVGSSSDYASVRCLGLPTSEVENP